VKGLECTSAQKSQNQHQSIWLKRAHFRLSENAPAALDKIDALLAQASYILLERDNTRTLGLFTFYSPKRAHQSHARSHLTLAN